MKKYFLFLKRLLGVLFAIGIIWCLFNFSLVLYGISQLKGQLHIVINARPMVEVLSDKNVPDSVKSKIEFIESVKRFAIDSLGLKNSKNYTTFYDQENKPLLWVVTASEPFKLKAYQWSFPFLGSVSYKGFFDYDKGKAEELALIEKGFDTDYDDVSAWSTLGWFRDPILSNMTKRSKGQLAELIIHELTHATIYLKSNVDFNENLASVCGEQGAIRFLQSTYGIDSEELKDYIFRKEDYDKFSRQMLIGTSMLDSLYSSMKDNSVILKLAAKKNLIQKIALSLDTVSFNSAKRYQSVFRNGLPNNTYFLGFVRYDAQKEQMKHELMSKFQGNIKSYIDYLREKSLEKN